MCASCLCAAVSSRSAHESLPLPSDLEDACIERIRRWTRGKQMVMCARRCQAASERLPWAFAHQPLVEFPPSNHEDSGLQGEQQSTMLMCRHGEITHVKLTNYHQRWVGRRQFMTALSIIRVSLGTVRIP